MTTERLRGSASYGRTFNIRPFESVRIDITEDFYLDEDSHEAVLARLKEKVAKLEVP